MNKDFTATISQSADPERAAAWREVFGGDTVILKSPIPGRANLPGKGETEVYEIDIAALTPEQRQRLITHLAAKFELDPDDVDGNLDQHGCPILSTDVWVTIHNPQRWF